MNVKRSIMFGDLAIYSCGCGRDAILVDGRPVAQEFRKVLEDASFLEGQTGQQCRVIIELAGPSKENGEGE